MNAGGDLPDADALGRLSRVHGPLELQAAILALITPPDSIGSFVAWTAETQACAHAPLLREDAMQVGEASRLPCLEALLERMGTCAIDHRRGLLQATRRVIAALTPVRPIDRLHWLVMRRKLGDSPAVAMLPDELNDLGELPAMLIVRVASVASYLARMVPGPTANEGYLWYRMAMAPLVSPESMPPYLAPDGEGFARALAEVDALPHMLRPVLVRAWVAAALSTSGRARLRPVAADALRLMACLLSSPLPPELARHFVETGWPASGSA